MIWFGKSFIKFCKSFINLIKLVSTRTCSSARVRGQRARVVTLSERVLVRSMWLLDTNWHHWHRYRFCVIGRLDQHRGCDRATRAHPAADACACVLSLASRVCACRDSGPTLGICPQMGSTSLTFAAQGGHLETVQLLLKKEADVQAVTKARRTRKRAQELAVLLDFISFK